MITPRGIPAFRMTNLVIVSSSDRELKEDPDSLEVTLAQEDRQYMGAHKVVLPPSSPLFRGAQSSGTGYLIQ